MTQRDRQASARNIDTPPPEARSWSGSLSTEATAAAQAPALLWERIFRAAAPDEQERLLSLARQQGVLFSYQLPPSRGAANGDQPAHAQVLSGRLDCWAPVRVQPFALHDADLDPIQREAVAKALQTPDLCLIQGLPGTGKRRVAAEIIHQAVARGERVLLLARRAGALDALLEPVAASSSVLPLRCLDREERLELLSPSIRRLTFREQLDGLQQALHLARKTAREADQRREQRQREEALWPELPDLAANLEALIPREEALRRNTLMAGKACQEASAAEAGATETGRTAFQGAFLESLRPAREALIRTEDAITECRKRIGSIQRERKDRVAVVTPLRLMADARKDGRWWSPLRWKAIFARDLEARVAELDAKEEQTRFLLAKLEEHVQELSREQERRRSALREERDRLIEIETARRSAEIETEEAAIRPVRAHLEGRWQETCAGFGAGSILPGAMTPEAVQNAHQAWQASKRTEKLRDDFAGEWADALEQSAEHLDQRLLDCVNLVAATVAGLEVDDHFGDVVRPRRTFDLLILLEAHEVTEAEFARVAGRASRSVLIGEPADLSRSENATALGTVCGKPGVHPHFLQRMWNGLHCDPRCLPYAWFRESGRLCCRLRPVAPEQRRWVECERLADFPEIELRILAQPRKPSELVEVVFPPGQSIHQAKEYIFKELEELPISTSGRGLRWDEQPDRLVLHLTDQLPSHSQSIVLEPGLRERIATPLLPEGNGEALEAGGWQTCCLEFDRSAGWDRRRAEEWVQRRLGLVDLGRTAWLQEPYRMQPDLALFLSHVLFAGQYRASNIGHRNGTPAETATPGTSLGAAVEFIPVPAEPGVASARPHRHDGPLVHHGGGRSASSTAARERRSGLELSLEVPEQRETLPEELRAVLPLSGYVNLAEAQAVAHALETLVNDTAFRAAARCSGSQGRRPTIGVVALYAAQVELIRRLIEQIPTLLAADVEILVETPEAIRDRECLITFVSFTRSHGHRAASLGDGPQRLVWALTRSTTKLVLFGDPATLKRRCQWEGPVSPLDAAASRRERDILSNLVTYLDGNGAHPRTFHLREGGWA
jgi:hypothetical protein